eukprot:TRINITY_DN10414_c0_g1_i1.p1 TRINITY_DN10414_c0_g1~~TRINITY_DN10414_c0_g1_i1.p1  ORF type:complete len:831 (+),score=137.79 TRINITY_DN10414_c0_g1_i1:192-2684(+)
MTSDTTVAADVETPMSIDKVGAEPPGKIIQLEETVINRIAAGEVVVRPANALKELMENSLDAKSRHIVVALKAGGLKMLRIEDDGHGIRKADLPILCERFTTSKLKEYDDLNCIATFGFRGEALASISHVAHITVTTMTKDDACAIVAQYTDGKLRAPPRPCAGTRGTTIVCEDLFYNNPTRRQALGKESMEHTRVMEVMQKYSIHNPTVSFVCRKAGSSVAELHTPGSDGTTAQDVIGLIYGQGLARELFSFSATSADPKFEVRGFASGPNWTTRSTSMTLFINHRLVECSALKKAVEAVYAPVLPRHQHPWIYLELELDPTTIDVNVHPTKNEVQFLNEELIARRVQEAVDIQLRERGGSRNFAGGQFPSLGNAGVGGRQSSKPAFFASANGDGSAKEDGKEAADATLGKPTPTLSVIDIAPPKRVDLNPTRVRTDHRQRSLQSIFRTSSAQDQKPVLPLVEGDVDTPTPMELDGEGGGGATANSGCSDAIVAAPGASGNDDFAAQRRGDAFAEAQELTSLYELKQAANLASDAKLSKSLRQSVYVGPVLRELAVLQCGPTLCLVNLARVVRECVYQRLLRLFGSVSPLVLKVALPLKEVLRLGINDPGSGYNAEGHAHIDVDSLATRFETLLMEKAEMLVEYLALEIEIVSAPASEGGASKAMLRSLPNALGVKSDAGLCFDGLPLFLIRLCCEVDWTEEKPCFEGLCRLIADFSVEMMLPSEEELEAYEGSLGARGRAAAVAAATASELNAAVEAGEFEDVAAAAAAANRKRARTAPPAPLAGLRWLHEAMREEAVACQWPGTFARDGTVVELVSLDQLYRIFERC